MCTLFSSTDFEDYQSTALDFCLFEYWTFINTYMRRIWIILKLYFRLFIFTILDSDWTKMADFLLENQCIVQN